MDTNASEIVVNIAENHANATSFESLTNSTEPVRSTPEKSLDYDFYYSLADDIYFYGLSIVIPFGLIGNVFSVCVFLLSSILRRTTTGQFLVALAIADSTVLVGDMMRWLAHSNIVSKQHYVSLSLGLNFHDTSTAACRITHFLRYGGGLWSVWLTIAIAVERLLAVAFPLRISQISTLRRSRAVIFIITIISFSLALFPFWLLETESSSNKKQMCRYKGLHKESYDNWNSVVIKFGTLIIPGVLIAVLTVMIIVLLYRARKKRMYQLAACTQNFRKEYSKLGLSTETQLTIMLVAVCIATTLLRAPYMITYYFRQNLCLGQDDCSELTKMQTFVAYRVTEVFYIINYAINFILYCFCGSYFRRQIKLTVFQETSHGNCLRNHPAAPLTPVTLQLQQLGS